MEKKEKMDPQTLTPLERAILKLIAEDNQDKETGNRIYISERSAKGKQMMAIMKLNARSITSVLDYALKEGLISPYEILESIFSKKTFEAN